jgi:tetratricopeptide (TPR) repeat protein
VLARQGEPAAAARDYALALAGAARPQPEHFVEHRDALVAAGDPAGALAALDAGIARIGPIVSLEIPAAALALDLGRPDDALARIDGLLARSPGNPILLARRGEVLARAGRTAEARAAYETALAVLERRPRHRRSERATALELEIRTALGAPAPRPTEEAR